MKRLLFTVLDHFFLLRPVLIIPVWAILVLAWITAQDVAPAFTLLRGGGGFAHLFGLFTLVAAFIFILNQIADVEGDRKNEKCFLLPRGCVSIRAAWALTLLSGLSALVWAQGAFSDPFLTGLVFSALLLGVLYNLPPASLKDRPVGGVIANFLGHGVLTYYIAWYVVSDPGPQGLFAGILYSLSAGFANAAVFVVSTIADKDGDAAVGKRTFAVVFGEKASVLLGAVLVSASLATAFLLPHNAWIMVLTAFLSTVLFWYFYGHYSPAAVFRAFRWPVVLLSVVQAVYFPPYALLVGAVVLLSRFYYIRRFGITYPAFGRER
ncbi:MAG: UbiA family prenyltransferase [Fibrobacterota bacterium]